ncbi:MAG: hypothetical protein ACI376_00765 [Candidatus Bruticola sp.]
MHSKLDKVKILTISLTLWTLVWLIGSLSWNAASSPYCFGESSVLKLYAYTAYIQGHCQELMHAPALFTLSRPFIAIFGCTNLTFSLIQGSIFVICALLTAHLASKLYGYKTGLLSFMLLTCSLSTAKGLRTFLLDYPSAVPLLLMYLCYLNSDGFKKLLPCLGLSASIWLGAQTKYSFLPVWAGPLSAALLIPHLHRAIQATRRLGVQLSPVNKKNLRLLFSSVVDLTALVLFTCSAKDYAPHLQPSSSWPWLLQLEVALIILSSIFSLYQLELIKQDLHPAWQRLNRGLASCTLGAGLSAWSYLPHLQAIWGHTEANYHAIASPTFFLVNMPSAWISYLSSVCQESLAPLPWFLLAAVGLCLVCLHRKLRRRSLPFIVGLIFVSVWLQTLPWDHAYQRFFIPLLPWWAMLAAHALQCLLRIKLGRYLAAAIVFYLWLHAACICWAWACPSISNYLAKLDSSYFLSEGLSLNLPQAKRTGLDNFQESFHPLQPPGREHRLTNCGMYNMKLSALPVLRQTWFDNLTALCRELAADGVSTQKPWYLAVIAEFEGRELKGESPAMELFLWCAQQGFNKEQLHITGINNPQAYAKAAGPPEAKSLTVLITNTGSASQRLQQDLYPALSPNRLIKQTKDQDSGLTIMYFASCSNQEQVKFIILNRLRLF